jgi:hypothetical protein
VQKISYEYSHANWVLGRCPPVHLDAQSRFLVRIQILVLHDRPAVDDLRDGDVHNLGELNECAATIAVESVRICNDFATVRKPAGAVAMTRTSLILGEGIPRVA